jgi:Fe-Mn family superoxide dismutase
MAYSAKEYTNLLGMDGFSDDLLQNHFTLYQGYVANTEKLLTALRALESEGKSSSPEYAECRRRFGWEFNGMRLHEYYFENLGGDGIPASSGKLYNAIVKEFSSFEAWEKEFRTLSAMRGIGWVILYYDPRADRLFNVWVNEHDVGHLSGCIPLLIIDIFEHAFLRDYGLQRADYINAFFKKINWKIVESRFE